LYLRLQFFGNISDPFEFRKFQTDNVKAMAKDKKVNIAVTYSADGKRENSDKRTRLKKQSSRDKKCSAKTFFSRRIRTKSCLSKAANLSSDNFKKLIQLLKIRFLRKLSSGLKRNLISGPVQ